MKLSNMVLDDSPNNNGDKKPEGKKTRRSVACKSCHSLKVKCTPADPNNPGGPCIRCLNTKRVCEIDINQPRKRRRKAEILEAKEAARLEAERKSVNSNLSENDITREDSMTDTESTSYHQPHRDINGNSETYHRGNFKVVNNHPNSISPTDDKSTVEDLKLEIANLKAQIISLKNRPPNYPVEYISKKDLQSEMNILSSSDGTSAFMELNNNLKESAKKRSSFIWNENDTVDAISKQVITLENAEMRLKLYNEEFYPRYPYVEVPQGMTAKELSVTQPYLFNAIMCITSLVLKDGDEGINQILEIVATKQLMIQVFIAGNKNEEFLKALILLGFWYNSPELVQQRRFHLLNALAIGLLHDLGIVAKSSDNESSSGEIAKVTMQQRKIIMLLFIGTVATCLILRRTIYVKWTPYVEECCSVLENSGDVLLVNLSILSRLNHVLEKIHNSIHSSEVNMQHLATSNWVIRDLQKELDIIKSRINSLEVMPNNHGIMAYYYSVEAYLHEPLLTQVAGLSNEGIIYLKTEAIQSISTCTSACVNCLEYFNLMGPQRIASVPLLYLSRIIYTAGMLLRLRFLILSFPLHIEKNLVPVDAIKAVEASNVMFLESAKLHPFNYCIKKISLMLQLFIQTYSNQVQSLVSSDGGTPQNLKEVHIDNLANELFYKTSNEVITSDSGTGVHPHVPLDVLSYAAAFRRSLKSYDNLKHRGSTSPSSPLQNEVNYNELQSSSNTGSKTNETAKNQPSSSSSSHQLPVGFNPLPQSQVQAHLQAQLQSQLQQQPQSKMASQASVSQQVPLQYRTLGMNNNSNTNTSGKLFEPKSSFQESFPDQTNQSPDYPTPLFNNILNAAAELSNSGNEKTTRNNSTTNPANQADSGPPANDMVNPNNEPAINTASGDGNQNPLFGVPGFEELDNSFYNIGEEFWGDIVNPNSNNFNFGSKGALANDVFFMA